jgi:hypothetical protein
MTRAPKEKRRPPFTVEEVRSTPTVWDSRELDSSRISVMVVPGN